MSIWLLWLRFVPVLLVLSTASGVAQTTSSQPASPKPDYSQEGAVVEQMSTRVSFDNQGNRTREQISRIRVNTDAGVQQWGLLTLPYQSAVETVEVRYVRVRKPDGTVVPTPEDNVQDLDSEITRSAPFYSDLREKHIAVKGLAKGDLLEYQIEWRPTKPLISGQFWFEYNFHPEGIVLDESLEILVPVDRPVKFKGPLATQSIRTDGFSRIYRWSFSRLENAKDEDPDRLKVDSALGRLPAPDVQLSSFQSWEELGNWYWNLQKERTQPSDAIRAKAAELTKGLADEPAKIRALYRFVSVQYRYIGISFGIGRYQPHSADDVLGNNYGDCKDKHTLFAALLQASGITLYPALINATRKLDPDVPSPGQFDHIIGYLPQSDGATWLDTTPEVAPFGYLVAPLRDKSALVMLGEKSAKLITTPADPPFLSEQKFNIEGKLQDDGTFVAHAEHSSHGDSEVMLRLAFRRVAQSQWKDLVQGISYAMGFAGTVSDISASPPDGLNERFHFSYDYNRKDYPDWSNHQFTVPGLPFLMPVARDDAKDPVWLGPPLETVSSGKIELPKGYKPQLPSNVDLVYDFAEYHAAYKEEAGTVISQRRLLIKRREVPLAELSDYRTFVKNLQNDVLRYIQTLPTSAHLTPSQSSFSTLTTLVAGIQNLPDSKVDEANKLEADARSAASITDLDSSEKLLKGAVASDPKFTRGWAKLATLFMMQKNSDAAIDALHHAIDSDPKSVLVRKLYAFTLASLNRFEAAEEAWRDLLQLAPDDPEANSAVATLLLRQRRYSDAVPYLELVAKQNPSTVAAFSLGSTYLKAGQTDKGVGILKTLLETDKNNPTTVNDVAYELADANIELPTAVEFAQKAVEAQERQSHDAQLSNLLKDDLDCTQKIASFWDTLGWAEFRLGHLDRAESYLQAAWLLSQISLVADHLGQVYEKEQKRDKAAHMYRLAMATPEGRGAAGNDPQKHLEALGEKTSPNVIPLRRGNSEGDELSKLRTVKLKYQIASTGTAEFFLLFNGSSKPEQARFVSGSEALRYAANEISNLTFDVTFPAGSSAHLVRRAILMCSKLSGCEVVLYTPSSVHSVN